MIFECFVGGSSLHQGTAATDANVPSSRTGTIHLSDPFHLAHDLQGVLVHFARGTHKDHLS